MLAREIFIRRSPLAGSRWLPFLVVCFCLAFSALYELIEFWTALATGEAAEAFLAVCREHGMDADLGRRLPGLLRGAGDPVCA